MVFGWQHGDRKLSGLLREDFEHFLFLLGHMHLPEAPEGAIH